MLQCCYCSKEFKYESEKKRHEQSHTPQFECKECFKKFSFLSALRRHRKQHERLGSVQCLECGRNFRDDILLQRHKKYAHKGTFTCSKCNSKFNSDLALMSHMKTHKPKAERRFHCNYEDCNKSFNFQHHLKHHKLTHTNAKQHFCKICGKGFIQFHHLKLHTRSHEPESWLNCTVPNCKKKFVTEYARKRHLTTHKNSVDSGISSDSNCDNAQDSLKEKELCAKCGQMITVDLYAKHETECTAVSEVIEISLKENQSELNNNYNNIEVFSNCKSILGKCIANENSPNSCLCAQINEANNFYDDLLPNENFSLKDQNDIKVSCDNNSAAIFVNNGCEGCECSGAKSSNIQSVDSSKDLRNIRTDEPKFEFRNDGAIKLKDTFDLSFNNENDRINETDDYLNINSNVLYNSCKAVLGKCIVSGNGTISDNCLCAKMTVDDQMTAQEIDEITPMPTMSS